MKLIILSIFVAAVSSCVYKNEKYKDGETWVARSTFVMQCKITKSGWTASIIGCKTADGDVVKPGEEVTKNGTKYACIPLESGRVEIRRTLKTSNVTECDGHKIGESWIVNVNFHKKCTEKGERVFECLSDAGIPVPLGSTLMLSGIQYTCTKHGNGTVTIHRDVQPKKSNFKNNLLKPANATADTKPATVEKEVKPTTTKAPKEIVCNVDGTIHKPEESWVSDEKFTKKCTPEGSVVILNCLIDKDTTINVGQTLILGTTVHKCERHDDDSVHYSEKPVEE